jgi:hypothetical protein
MEVERLNAALVAFGKYWESERKTSPYSHKAETSVSCHAQENRRNTACTMGEMERRRARQVSGFG